MIDNAAKNRRNAVIILQSVLLLLFGITHYCGGLNLLRIGNAVPMLSIPFLVVVAFYSGMWRSVVFGILYGIFADSIAAGTLCFNTVCFTLITLVAGYLITYMFNNNISAAILLGVLSAVFYFGARWLFLFVLKGISGSGDYLFDYALPSAIYTAVFTVPFYYIGKFLVKRAEQR